MQTSPRYGRATHSSALSKQRRSGYEPSDTETDFHESPWQDLNPKKEALVSLGPRLDFDSDPLKISRWHATRFDFDAVSPRKAPATSPARRRHSSKSPYKPRRDEDDVLPALKIPNSNGNVKSHKFGKEDHNLDELVYSNRKQNHRMVANPQLVEVSRLSKKPNYSKRSVTAPRVRPKEKDDPTSKKSERTTSPLPKANGKLPSVGEINEMIANAKLSRGGIRASPMFESTDSISPGDIFFSREWNVLALPKSKLNSQRDSNSHFPSRENRNLDHIIPRGGSSGTGLSSGRYSTESSKMSEASAKTSESMKKFTANRKKSHKEAWFACGRKGYCRSSKSPEKAKFDETLFIERAFVVENLRQFWADQYQPGSLNGFSCHKREAQLLKQLASHDILPHILLKGPTGSGKRALAMALLREIYGDSCWDISNDLRYFQVQEQGPMQVAVPIRSSAHHLELNVRLESNATYALMGLVREITKDFEVTPETSNVNFKANYKVMVLHDVDKAADSNVQHLLKWILDCYADSCKLILCCEDDEEIIDSVKDRCKVIKVDAPVTHEIMEVLIQIARKEDFELPMGFAAQIAIKSKENMRKAIMTLEACKAHNYPFVEDQPIPIGWDEVVVEIAAEILANPQPNRLFNLRGRFQKLLVDFVDPKLILQMLVEQFLKGTDAGIKRELYYWHAYYDKRLPTGTTALLKLEEFVVKFMSIYRKSCGNRQIM
ncbi:hypothetical protein UlMin_039561 [Ulmus minor]